MQVVYSSTTFLLLCLHLHSLTEIDKMFYHINRNIDSDFNLAIWQLHKDHQINLRHYQSISTTSMCFFTYSTQNRQFKILPQRFFSKPPNIIFANNSAYTVIPVYVNGMLPW